MSRALRAAAAVCQFIERDDVFNPLQIVVMPLVIFIACLVYGG